MESSAQEATDNMGDTSVRPQLVENERVVVCGSGVYRDALEGFGRIRV